MVQIIRPDRFSSFKVRSTHTHVLRPLIKLVAFNG